MTTAATFCPHGVSHQPGAPDAEGRSQWCVECFPEDEVESRLEVAQAENRLLWSVIGSLPSSYIKAWSSESEAAFLALPKQPDEAMECRRCM